LLEALAWWAAMGHAEPTRTQLAAKAGWTPKGQQSSQPAVGALAGRPGRISAHRHRRLTPAGAAAAPEPDTGETLIESIRAVLTGPQRLIFDVLLEHPGAASHLAWEARSNRATA
jgi:hypothetical protein